MGGPYAVRATGKYLLVVARAAAVATAHSGRRAVAAHARADPPVPTRPPNGGYLAPGPAEGPASHRPAERRWRGGSRPADGIGRRAARRVRRVVRRSAA